MSLAYVDAHGEPLDVTGWLVANAWVVGIPGAVVALGFVAEPNHTSARGGLELGAALTLATACVSRIWSLVHDRSHTTATREWWEAHHADTRQHLLRGSLTALAALVIGMAFCLSGGQSFVAAALVGPTVGALFVLVLSAESARLRRSGRRGQWIGPLRR